ncbi:MAG: LamG-like jellyroll fold domain-containing protein [Patescibacteria group bacterium]
MKNLKNKLFSLLPKFLSLTIIILFLSVLISTGVKGARPVLPVSEGGTGTSTIPSIGQLLIGNGIDYSLSTLIAGIGITVTNGPGSITVANNGVLSINGTPNQVNVSSTTGTVNLSLPQDITTSSSPTFSGLTLNNGGVTFADGTTQTSAAPAGIPVGTIVAYAATTTPVDWLLADGSAISRTTYSDLFAVIGIIYGQGDGSTTFNLPNFQSQNLISTSISMPPDTGQGLILNWHLDETSGLVIADSSGNNNNGTANGTTIVAGKFGNARNFNGTSDYVASNTNTGITGSSPFTISAWFKYGGAPTDWGPITSIGHQGFSSKDFFAITSKPEAGNRNMGLNFDDGSLNTYWDTGIDLSTEMNHVVVVYDGIGTIYVYINGSLNLTRTGVGSMAVIDDPVRVGGRSSGYTQYFNGVIDEVRIYNRALPGTEIQNLYSTSVSAVYLIKY